MILNQPLGLPVDVTRLRERWRLLRFAWEKDDVPSMVQESNLQNFLFSLKDNVGVWVEVSRGPQWITGRKQVKV